MLIISPLPPPPPLVGSSPTLPVPKSPPRHSEELIRERSAALGNLEVGLRERSHLVESGLSGIWGFYDMLESEYMIIYIYIYIYLYIYIYIYTFMVYYGAFGVPGSKVWDKTMGNCFLLVFTANVARRRRCFMSLWPTAFYADWDINH